MLGHWREGLLKLIDIIIEDLQKGHQIRGIHDHRSKPSELVSTAAHHARLIAKTTWENGTLFTFQNVSGVRKITTLGKVPYAVRWSRTVPNLFEVMR